MFRIMLLGILLSLPGLAQACNKARDVCDFPSDSETFARATETPVVYTERRLLGNDRNEALARRLAKAVKVPVVCASWVLASSRGNYNAALCAPKVCLSLLPTTPMDFSFSDEVSRRAKAGEAVYVLTGPAMRACVRAHFDRFGWKAWRY